MKFGKPIVLPDGIHDRKDELQKESNMILDKIYELDEKKAL